MDTRRLSQILPVIVSVLVANSAAAAGPGGVNIQSGNEINYGRPGASMNAPQAPVQQSSGSVAPVARNPVLPPESLQQLDSGLNHRYQEANSTLSLEASYLSNKLDNLKTADDRAHDPKDSIYKDFATRDQALGIFCEENVETKDECYERYKRTAYTRLIEIRKALLINETQEATLRNPVNGAPVAEIVRDAGAPVPMKQIEVPYIPTTQEVADQYTRGVAQKGSPIFDNGAWAANFKGQYAPQEIDFLRPDSVAKDPKDPSSGKFWVVKMNGPTPVKDQAAYANFINKFRAAQAQNKKDPKLNNVEARFALDAKLARVAHAEFLKGQKPALSQKTIKNLNGLDRLSYDEARMSLIDPANKAVEKMTGTKTKSARSGVGRSPAEEKTPTIEEMENAQVTVPPPVRDVAGEPDRDINVRYEPGTATDGSGKPSNDGIEAEIEHVDVTNQ